MLLLTLSVVFTVSFLEFTTRLYLFGTLEGPSVRSERSLRQPHPILGWDLKPGQSAYEQTLAYRVHVNINSHGLRDVEHEFEKPEDTYRILILGDSFMEAYQVPLEESFPRQLSRRLGKKVEVINLGVGGYGTVQQYLAFREKGLRYDPDLVLLGLYTNDIRNNSKFLERKLGGPDSTKVALRPFANLSDSTTITSFNYADTETIESIHHKEEADFVDRIKNSLVIYQIYDNVMDRLFAEKISKVRRDPNLRFGKYQLRRFYPSYNRAFRDREQFHTAWNHAWNVTKATLLKTKELATENDAKFVVFTVPSKAQVLDDFQERVRRTFPKISFAPRRLGEKLYGLSSRYGVNVLDLRDPFKKAIKTGKRKYYFKFDGHWNANGHNLAVDNVSAYLKKRGMLQ